MKITLQCGKIIFLCCAFFIFPDIAYPQVPTCGSNVPYYFVDLTGKPAGSWTSPNHSRKGHCCGYSGTDECTSFEVLLDSNAAAVIFSVVSGAMPVGALYYQIDCGQQVPIGEQICISGVGPHRITFCKPGNNTNTYKVTSISKPTLPSDTTVRIGCVQKIPVLGIEAGSAQWTSVYPGSTGQYDSYLSCTDCLSPDFTPDDNAPEYIDYLVCGYPQADECGYNLTVCDTVRITIKSRLSGTVTPPNASFCQIGPGSGVTLTAQPSGGNGNYTYIWRSSPSVIVGTEQSYFATAQGSYSVEIRDGLYNAATCASEILSVQVMEVPLPEVNAGEDQTICAIDARAHLSGTFANAPGATWSGGNGTFSPGPDNPSATYWPDNSEILAGTAKLILTSDNNGSGCPQVSDTIILTIPQALTIDFTAGAANCSGSTTMLTAGVSGGMPPYSYSWNTGASSPSVNVPPGTFCVTVTDGMGCNTTSCHTIVAPEPLALTMSSTNATVNGGSDGTASANVSGGMVPYTYLWSNGETTSVITGLSYGAYTVEITDAGGCSINGSIVVNEPRCLGLEISLSNTTLSCYGDADASATAIVSGGTAPFEYLWDNGQTTAEAVNLSQGTYTVYVTDSTGCIASRSITILTPSPLINTFTYADATNITEDNGYATANAFGGSPGYTYAWSTGANDPTISGLTPGIYHVTITDSKGCSFQDSVLINRDSCSDFRTSLATQSPSCHGGNDGSATVFVNLGAAPFLYSWSTGDTTASVSGLSQGSYSVITTDATGCYSMKTVYITQPANLSLGMSATDVTCHGENNGTIETTISGGTYPYNFSWSNGSNTEDLIYLAPDNYSLIATDANGCEISGAVAVSQPDSLIISYTTTDPTCFGNEDGSIDVNISGGMAPYSYQWSTGATTKNVSGLGTGTYSMNINDANGCSLSTAINIHISEPAALTIDSVVVACPMPGSDITHVVLTPSGGDGGPFQISFDNGTTFMNAGIYEADLTAGSSYQIIVKDGSNCTSPVAYNLEVNPMVTITDISYNKCAPTGSTEIAVVVSAAGGDSGPYEISYDNGALFESSYSKDLAPGNSYSISARDASGCISGMQEIYIPEPLNAALSADLFNGDYNVSCHGNSDGAITVTATGGTQPYTFTWDSPDGYSSAEQNISGLSAGDYILTMTDTNGCLANAQITLIQPEILTASAEATHVQCNGFNTGSIVVATTGGVEPYAYEWADGSSSQSISGLSSGNYHVTITDANGCIHLYSVAVNEESPVLMEVATTDETCYENNDGSATAMVTGGVAPYTIHWSNGASGPETSGLQAGIYNVSVTDNNGCHRTETFTITQPDSLYAQPSAPLQSNGHHLTFYKSADGSIEMLVAGGTEPYQFSWNNGAVTKDLSHLQANTYHVVVTDAHGCRTTAEITLSEPDDLMMPTGFSPNGDGKNDYFHVRGLEAYPDNNFTVVNRWGNTVFKSVPYRNDWSGVNNSGEPLPDGTYFVVLTINGEEIVLTGYVDIRR